MPRVAVTLALLVGIGVLDVHAGDRSAVSVLLTTGPDVSPAARMALMRETTGIWARAGIHLEWVSSISQPSGLSLRVLTVERTAPASREDAALLGELVRGAGTMPVALIALDQATAIAARARSVHPDLDSDECLGLVLGRIIAHELGHFLLAATPHTPDGLMRAHFPESELTNPWSAAFELNAAMKQVARTSAAKGFAARVPAASIPAAASTREKTAD